MTKTMLVSAALSAFVAVADPAAGVHVGLDLPPGPNNPRNSEGAFMPLKENLRGQSPQIHCSRRFILRQRSSRRGVSRRKTLRFLRLCERYNAVLRRRGEVAAPSGQIPAAKMPLFSSWT